MKRLLIILIPLLLLGGGGFAMWKLGMPPYPKHAKSAKAAALKDPPPTIAEALTDSAPPTPAPANDSPRKTTATAKPSPNTPVDPVALERKVARLTEVYEGMPVEDAARIMAKLPDPLVERILRRMDERQAGKLLVSLPIDRAAKLTQALAK